MATWQERLRGLLFVGWANAYRALRYARMREEWQTAAAAPAPPQTPGPLRATEPLPAGVRWTFDRATLEVVFLQDALVRCTWTPGSLPPDYTCVRRDPPQTPVHLRREDGHPLVQSAALQVLLAPEGLLWRDLRGRVLLRTSWPILRGTSWTQQVDLSPGPVLGLGERAAPADLRPGRYRLWNRDPGGAYGPGADPLYLSLPVLWVHRPAPGYLLFYENPHDGWVTLDERLSVTFADGALRYYFILGPAPEALERFTWLTGRPPLPPRWALGLHQARWGYRTQAEVAAVLEGYRRHEIPLAAVHLDIDHMDGFRVFTHDPKRYPDPAALTKQAHAQGVRVVTIVDPGVKRDPRYPVYRSGLEREVFCRLPDGRVFHAPVWPGWCAFPDFTAPHARAWWGEQYATLIAWGVDGFWHDMNEPSVFAAWGEPTFPDAVRHALDGQGGDHRTAHNLYGLLMNRAAFEALRRLRPQRRPWLLSRSGWVGLQRYAWHWTGDTESTWEALRMTVSQMLHLGLSGIPFTGPDIGGFAGALDGELFTRWFQLATFLPFFRIHSSLLSPPREPWRFPDPYLRVVKAFAHWRQRFLPYLYTLAWEAHRWGWPLVRPLWWQNPDEEALWRVDDAFLLGDALLVAPVLEPGATMRSVPLPPGLWYDFWSGEPVEGGRRVSVAVSLERIPLFVRAGTVLPLAEMDGTLTLRAYLPWPGEVAQGRLYLDAGEGYGPYRLETYLVAHGTAGWQAETEVEGTFPDPFPARRWRFFAIAE